MQFNSTQLTFCHRSPNEGLKYTDFSTTFSTGNVYHTVLTVIDDSNGDGNVIGYNNGVNLGERQTDRFDREPYSYFQSKFSTKNSQSYLICVPTIDIEIY